MHTKNTARRAAERTDALVRVPLRRAATVGLVLLTGAALATTTACGKTDSGGRDPAAAGSSAAQESTGKKVLWMGDSIADTEAPPLQAALKASGVEFKSAASDGGGTVVQGDGPSAALSKSTWKDFSKNVASFHPNVIAYQITTYDWGDQDQQRSSYERLAKAAQEANTPLVLVSAPPYKIDDFYKPQKDAIESAPKVAKEVADKSGGKVHFLNASALWGTDNAASKAQRSPDGIHSCQQGSAAFAKWFTDQLGELHGFRPAAAKQWANGSWTGDERFAKLNCG
ncbi:SGNH/GDSL hydrolase family protein [Streptomyces sp. NPDC048434]|uniref:SGNH/GDSL hydrolase family protein n=1 Tax=Streptomyces sp. NPDC048434 TaxID=3365549 RepID=UPI00371BC764